MSSFFTGVFAAEAENPAELNKRSFAAHMLHKYPNGSFLCSVCSVSRVSRVQYRPRMVTLLRP